MDFHSILEVRFLSHKVLPREIWPDGASPVHIHGLFLSAHGSVPDPASVLLPATLFPVAAYRVHPPDQDRSVPYFQKAFQESPAV